VCCRLFVSILLRYFFGVLAIPDSHTSAAAAGRADLLWQRGATSYRAPTSPS
jgi:hypothetical protein